MTWNVVQGPKFEKQIKKLDKSNRERVLVKLYGLETLDNPEDGLVPYTANLAGLWKLRVGNYRVILDIRAGELIILALEVEHRSKVYKHRS